MKRPSLSKSSQRRSQPCGLDLLCLAAALLIPCGAPGAQESSARGAYLARITGCVGCHSPRAPSGDVVENKLLSGGDHPIPGGPSRVRIYPPNLTPDRETGLGGWQVSDIVRAVREGVAPGDRHLSSAMPSRSQFRHLDDADATAIAAYLKSVPAVHHAVPPPVSAEPKG